MRSLSISIIKGQVFSRTYSRSYTRAHSKTSIPHTQSLMQDQQEERNIAAWQHEPRGPITVGEAEMPEPREGEVRIKVHAVPLQPAESKIALDAIYPNFTYPCILGSVVAGTIHAIGPTPSTTPTTSPRFQIGDRVSAGLANYIRQGRDRRVASLQRFAIAEVGEVVRLGQDQDQDQDQDGIEGGGKPARFQDAVAWCSQTPAAALFANGFLEMRYPVVEGMGVTVPVPAVSRVEKRGEEGKILISGGSSAMGALSIRYAKMAGYEVVTTCSAHNEALVRGLGADWVFDRNEEEGVLLEKMKKLLPIQHWFETVCTPESLTSVGKLAVMQREVLQKKKDEEEGVVKVMMLLPPSWPGLPKLPEGVEGTMMLFRGGAEENRKHMEWLMGEGGFLEKGLRGGWIRGVPAEVIGGLDRVQWGIEQLARGVSAKKLVIDPWFRG